MTPKEGAGPGASRRAFIAGAGGLAAVAGAGLAAAMQTPAGASARNAAAERFWGRHQGGIITPPQSHTYFAAFDLAATRREEVVALLRGWTEAAARMAAGKTAHPLGEAPPLVVAAPGKGDNAYAAPEPGTMTADSGEALGLPPARLTITFGFGPGLFSKAGKDRYGLAARRPEAFVDLPRFVGDQLVEAQTGGDLSVQACADDPQVAFHAVRQLARLSSDSAKIRWVQTGYIPNASHKDTPRNLMGFKDGTNNPAARDQELMDRIVWVGDEGPDWMRGGSYMVARRIRIALEHWDRMTLAFQEQTIGRRKYSGAPLGKDKEFDAPDLEAVDKQGNLLIAENAHVRLAAPATNDGAQILRRPYSYTDGVDFVAERWPPWRQGLEYDAGLFFVCYQRDPRTGFIKIQERVSKFDMMNQFVTAVGGGLFACPGGPAEAEFVGQRLFEA